MTRKARLLVLAAGTSQMVLLALGWAFAVPFLLQLPSSLWTPHLWAVALMLGVVALVQGAAGALFRWRWRDRPRAEMPVRMLATTLFASWCAAGVGWAVLYYRLDEPYGLALPVAAFGVAAVVATVSLVISREWLRRITAKELGDDPAFGRHTPGRRSRIGLRGLLLLTIVVMAAGSTALVGAYGYVQAEYEELLRREREAAVLTDVVARRLSALPRSRLISQLWHLPTPEGVILRLVDRSGRAVARPRGTPRAGVRGWQVTLRENGRCQSRNPGVKRCRWRALDFPHDQLRVVALVVADAPDRRPLIASILAFSLALLVFASFVAHLMGGDASRDLVEVAQRIHGITEHPEQGWGDPIPPTTTDEVGLLLMRFGELRRWLSVELDASRVDLDRTAAQDQEKAQYLEEVSFALRTYLTGILGHGELLLEGKTDGRLAAAQQQDVRILLDSSGQLLQLVRDIVDVAYAEAGAIHVRPAPVDLAALVDGQLAAARAALDDKAVTLRSELPETLDVVVLDESHIRRVLGNLLSNAVKFTEDGEVVVQVTDHDDSVRVAVRDTGTGIAAEHLAVIFEQYRQAPQARIKHQRGSGLGLAISRQLVQLHGGELGVTSERGKGSEFWFTLPRQGPPRAGAALGEGDGA